MTAWRVTMFVCAAGGCAAAGPPDTVGERERPVIGGELTAGDPAVVALTMSGVDAFCTGTLVSPRVVLTAAHCVDMPGAIGVYLGPDITGEGIRIAADLAYIHPQWSAGPDGFDIGLLRLAAPVDPLVPVPLAEVAPQDGAAYRVVGFGISERGVLSDGSKRQATTAIVATPDGTDVILFGDEDVSVCFGDSGGPGFLVASGVEVVAGIHSFTSADDCRSPGGDTRVDLYADEVIRPWIQANDPTCGADDRCSRIGCAGDPDCQPCGPDGTCADQECELPDVDCPTGEVGDICRADSQCSTGLCVAWSGDGGYRFCSRACDPASPCPDGMSCQEIAPGGSICTFDRTPPGVIGDSCSQATDCGSYLCEDGVCVSLCDRSTGGFCPPGFECESGDAERDFCRREVGSGGCTIPLRDPGAAMWWNLAVLLAAARIMGRRRRLR